MPPTAALLETLESVALESAAQAVAVEARRGLTETPKNLSPWLFYDEAGSRLFEQITALPEYYLTRTEREIFAAHADDLFDLLLPSTSNQQPATGNPLLTIAELGAGTASKTGILLRALARRQGAPPASGLRSLGSQAAPPASGPHLLGPEPHVLYQPIDISPTALDEAHIQLEAAIPGVTIRPQIANYVTGPVRIERPPHTRVLALYIGSSIGNFTPAEACQILTRLRSELQTGDALLLGVDLAPCLSETSPAEPSPSKSIATLLAAYNDSQGVTAAFNRNILARLNRELGANFRPERFLHRARWNPVHSRIEIYLESIAAQTVTIPANSAGPALTLRFVAGETIHTENSYKFTPATIATLLADTGFASIRTFTDPAHLFAVTLATAV